jgi:hypothetical protein
MPIQKQTTKDLHTTPKNQSEHSKSILQLPITDHPITDHQIIAAVVNPPAFFPPHKTDTKLATGTETCMVHYVLHHTLIHSLTLSGIR